MFRHYRVILMELVFITSPSYISISVADVGNGNTIPGWHGSVETCRSVVICKLIVIVFLLVLLQNNKMKK